MSDLTPFLIAEIRIEKIYRQANMTTVERQRYLDICVELALSHRHSTWALSRAMGEQCKPLRRDLRRMERHGLVVADSNGFNNIYWSLAP
ncbi:hypothetical protein [Pseudomonas juntendi]|uniref:hypothetical protein n=1 Tax=Pseudomonas juntendi TaxID=2666183 RepID=UPI00320A024D